MFTGYEHDPPDNDNIMLCAGPEERKALSNILLYRTPICNCDDFINELHTVLQKQTNSITQINEKFGPNTLREEDACVSFDRHLSDMCQEDVDKVMRHLHVLFITREYDVTGVNGLDYQVTIRRRESIFKDFIIPWIDWVRSAKQNRSDTVVSDKAINQSKTDSSNIDKKPNTIEYNTNITTNNKLTNNIKYTMFSKFEHDPPDNDDILLCAGPKERKALEEALRHHPHIYSVERFITTLHSSVQKQAACIEDINYALKTDLLYAEDAEISFDKHLSGMCQEDVDKVFKHLGVLLIDRRHMLTGNYTLDVILSDDDRKEIYNEIIVPWLNWVRSAKQDKSIAEMSDNTDTEVSNKDSHIFNQFKNEFEYQSGNDSDNNIILYANNAERYALQKALMDYMSSFDAGDLITKVHNFLSDDLSEGTTHFSKLSRGEVKDVLERVKYLFTNEDGTLDTLEDFYEEQIKNIYGEVIEPWFQWLKEQKPKKANNNKSNKPDTETSDKSSIRSETNSPDDKSDNKDKKPRKKKNNKPNPTINKKPNNIMDSHIFNQFKNEFEYQSGNDSDNNIILYANNAERYALQKALMDYMSSNAASTLIEDIHMFLDDDSPEGDTCFYKLNRGEVEDVLNDVKYLVTESYGELDTLEDFDEEQRNDLYNNVFEPWFRWLQEQKPKKANGKKATTNVSKKSNTSTNNKVNTPTNTNTNNTMNDNTTDKTMNASKNNMFGSIASIFSNMLGTLEPNTIRLTFDGNIAVKTAKGYKTYSVAKKKAVNMDSLVMPDMSVFLLLPSTKVKPGDIIFRDDIFYSIISVDNEKGELEVYNYEAGKRETLVKETHCFLGNTYFYSKLISPILSCFGKKSNPVDKKDEGSVGTETSEDTASMLLPLAMMSQNGDMNSLLPLMLMSKMEGNGESSGMMKMLMLSSMMGNNTGMNNMLPLMLLDGNFPSI